MKFPWQISAGEFFELLRPAAFVGSALLSTWVLASARRWTFRLPAAFFWALGTFFFPFVILPLYLLVRASRKKRIRPARSESESAIEVVPFPPAKFRRLLPTIYGIVLISFISFYIYRDYQSVDGHLARAAQARVMNRRDKTIREYRAALRIEDNPHTHKLLGIELADSGQWTDALREFRAAERGGEPDPSLPFLLGKALEETGNGTEAILTYDRYLRSAACEQALPDDRCQLASQRMGQLQIIQPR